MAILEAAGTLLAKDGPEGLSVSQVAQLAKVNRGTAYQHFQTREQLVEATTGWVSEQLCQAVFGKTAAGKRAEGRLSAEEQAQRSEEHTSELQSLMRISYAVFCLKKKNKKKKPIQHKIE